MTTPRQQGRIERTLAVILAAGVRRREFLALTGGVMAAIPFASRYSRADKINRLGVLQPGAPPEPLLDALEKRLRELGYIEGKNLIIEKRWAEGRLDRLKILAAELVSSKVDVITTLSTSAVLAARSVTTTIPIVFTAVGDPVGAGVVRARRVADLTSGRIDSYRAMRWTGSNGNGCWIDEAVRIDVIRQYTQQCRRIFVGDELIIDCCGRLIRRRQ